MPKNMLDGILVGNWIVSTSEDGNYVTFQFVWSQSSSLTQMFGVNPKFFFRVLRKSASVMSA